MSLYLNQIWRVKSYTLTLATRADYYISGPVGRANLMHLPCGYPCVVQIQSSRTRKRKAMADTVDVSKRDEIAAVKKNAVERLGAWTAHNIYLGDGIHTMDAPQNDARLRRVLQVAADIAGKPLNEL